MSHVVNLIVNLFVHPEQSAKYFSAKPEKISTGQSSNRAFEARREKVVDEIPLDMYANKEVARCVGDSFGKTAKETEDYVTGRFGQAGASNDCLAGEWLGGLGHQLEEGM